MKPLILDFDGSVKGIDDAPVIALRDQQEEIRFACSVRSLQSLGSRIDRSTGGSVVFLGSGDYHHVTFLLLRNLQPRRPIEVLVFDNHPDNMRYPFGIHCGSWVSHAIKLPFVSRIHVAGITSVDVEGFHAIENRLRPLRNGKVSYWCIGRDLTSLRSLGVRGCRSFPSAAEMLDHLRRHVTGDDLYLSVDKDVLAPDVACTNWDQGVMRLEELTSTIASLRQRVIAADVTGEISAYHYRGAWKRLLTAVDRQPKFDLSEIEESQSAHAIVNRALLKALESDPR